MLHVCFATRALADWALVMPPRTTNTDCTIAYREDAPVDSWSVFRTYPTKEECEGVRVEVARRRALSQARIHSRWDWGAPLGWVTKWFFDPSTWDECARVADYWALEHTRCTEK